MQILKNIPYFLSLILPAILISCAGLQPVPQRPSDAEFEKGLTTSEEEFKVPIDILKGVWNPADTASLSRQKRVAEKAHPAKFFIQIISVRSKNRAVNFVALKKRRNRRIKFYIKKRGNFWAVQIGDFQTREAAEKALKAVWQKKYPDAWIVKSK
ncbi:sporulation related domain protein [bacterium BMS3Abin05]|nr:sporulation related domain protein [bacterium BMS3Abin05]GBE26525.1 sporulation related domain protein [bacterium BMS3Bbin03]